MAHGRESELANGLSIESLPNDDAMNLCMIQFLGCFQCLSEQPSVFLSLDFVSFVLFIDIRVAPTIGWNAKGLL